MSPLLLCLSLIVAPARAEEPETLTLAQALARLDAQNPTLAGARGRLDEAEALRVQAISGLLPTVTGVGNYTRNNAEVKLDLSALGDLLDLASTLSGEEIDSSNIPSDLILQPLEAFSASGVVKVPLLVPSAWFGVTASARGIDAASDAARATTLSLQAALVTACWAEASAESLTQVAQASAERARKHAALVDTMTKAGVATQLASLQASAEAARHEQDALSAQAVLDRARVAVGVLVGTAHPVVVTLPEETTSEPDDLASLTDAALSHRPEVAAADAQVAAIKAQVLSTELGALPTVSGSFTASASTVEYPTGDDTAWKATVDLTWPLVAGGARIGRLQQLHAQLDQAEAAAAAQRLTVSQEVENALADLRVATSKRHLAATQRELAESAMTVAETSWRAGTLSESDLLDASDRLDQARYNEVDAQARLAMATVALQKARGLPW